MQVKENLKNCIIVLDKEKDFSKKSLNDLFKKIAEYKKLPFHDVILNMHLKDYVKFWEWFYKNKIDFKGIGINNDKFTIQF